LAVVDQRLRQNPRDTDALFAKAAALAKVEDLAAAIAALDTLASIEEGYPGLWVLKAKLHARRGDREKAQEARVRAQEVERRQERASQPRERTAPPPPAAQFECPECGAAVGERDSVCPSGGVLFEGAAEVPERELPPPQPKSEIPRRGLTHGPVP